MKYLFIICTIFAISCTDDDSCKTGEYRCKGDIEQICVSGDWLESTDCSKSYSPNSDKQWICCESSDLYDGGPGCDLPEYCKE